MNTRVLIAGSGVAAVECALALRELAGPRAIVELLSPAAELVYRPTSVETPFGGPPAARIDLTGLGVHHHPDALASVEAERHRVITRDGLALPYDVLVVATGARSRDAVPGAITFRGPTSAGLVEHALADPAARVVFTAPPGRRWLLPMYELALLSAATLREGEIAVATGEHEPLEVFGPAVSEAVRRELLRAGVDLVTSAAAVSAVDGALLLADGSLLPADVVVALPEVVGPAIAGLPHDDDGFIAVDEHGHVIGCSDVFAAGDVTASPLKHGGLAAQQADAVAETIAARLGGVAIPEPFRPVLRAALATGDGPLYLQAELGQHGLLPAPGTCSRSPLWWPPNKVAGRYLSRHLEHAPDYAG